MHSAWFEHPPAANASAALADRSTSGPAARTARWQATTPAWSKSNVGIVMMCALLKDIEKHGDRITLMDCTNGPTIPKARTSNRVANERNYFLLRKSPTGFLDDHSLKLFNRRSDSLVALLARLKLMQKAKDLVRETTGRGHI